MIKVNIVKTDRNDAVGRYEDKLFYLLKDVPNVSTCWVHVAYFNSDTLVGYIKDVFLSVVKTCRNYSPGIVHILFSNDLFAKLISFLPFSYKIATVHHVKENISWFDKLPFFGYKATLSRYDSLIADSKMTKNNLIDIVKIDPSKISVVYLGYDPKMFFQDKENITGGLSYILMVGLEIPRKNLERSLRAFKKASLDHPDLFLVKVGGKEHGMDRNKINKLIGELGISEKVIFKGRVSDSELRKLYSCAEAYLFPSLLEGFGLPIIEAMACGCPVITSNIAPMSELVQETQVTVDPNSVSSIAEGIRKVLSESELKEKMKTEGIKRSSLFTWEKTVEKTIRVYKRLLD